MGNISGKNRGPKTGGRKANRSRYLKRAGQQNARTQTEKTYKDPSTSNGQTGRESRAKTLGAPCGKMQGSGLQGVR